MAPPLSSTDDIPPNIYGSKRWRLLELVKTRRETVLEKYFAKAPSAYQHIADFHKGIFECDYVSPLTISASNVDAQYMVVAQDWSSDQQLNKSPSLHVIDQGFDPKFITNGLLDLLLEKHLNTKRRECYLTNLFPFIKKGDPSKKIAKSDLEKCAVDFLVPQIQIVGAPIVICLGLDTFKALLKAISNPAEPVKSVKSLDEAISSPRQFGKSWLCAVAHTGAQGTKNRGMDKVHNDWQRISALSDAQNRSRHELPHAPEVSPAPCLRSCQTIISTLREIAKGEFMSHTPPPPNASSHRQQNTPLNLTVNGQTQSVSADIRASLLDVLREHLHLTGSKKGCDHGQCGACTVLVNGRRINACLTLAVMHQGDEIVTIEGLGKPGALHPMQEAFLHHDAFQCGYCTPGQICSAVGMLDEAKHDWPSHVSQALDGGVTLTDAEISERMSGNLCRCSAYPNIVDAIREVAGAGK